MNRIPSPSDRLIFVPVTVDSCSAGLVSNEALALVIGAIVPPAWPPLSLDGDTVRKFMVLLHNPERRGAFRILLVKKT